MVFHIQKLGHEFTSLRTSVFLLPVVVHHLRHHQCLHKEAEYDYDEKIIQGDKRNHNPDLGDFNRTFKDAGDAPSAIRRILKEYRYQTGFLALDAVEVVFAIMRIHLALITHPHHFPVSRSWLGLTKASRLMALSFVSRSLIQAVFGSNLSR